MINILKNKLESEIPKKYILIFAQQGRGTRLCLIGVLMFNIEGDV